MRPILPLLLMLGLGTALAPAQVAPITVTVSVVDAAGSTSSATYATTLTTPQIVVPQILITTTSIPAFVVGTPYTATVQLSGGTAPAVCSATGLPAGITITSSGTTCVISGTPTGAGTGSTGGGGTTVTAGTPALPLTSTTVAEVYPNIPLGDSPNLTSILPFYGPNYEYNKSISGAPVSPLSAAIMANLVGVKPSDDGVWAVTVVDSTMTPFVPIADVDTNDSDLVQMPVPVGGGWIENLGDGQYTTSQDGHRLILDRATGYLYESFVTSGFASDYAHQVFDTTSSTPERPYEMTSLAADGNSIADGLLTYDEAVSDAGIKHALRVTAQYVDGKQFMPPASHSGSNAAPTPGYAIYGSRLRLKASWQPANGIVLSRVNQNIVNCLKTYGLRISDVGAPGIISSVQDPRFANNLQGVNDGSYADILVLLGRNNTANIDIGRDFEMVDDGEPVETYSAEVPNGPGPVISSFTATHDSTGQYIVFTVSDTGSYYHEIQGLTVFRGNTLTVPIASVAQLGGTATLVSRNQFATTTKSVVIQ